MIESRSLPTTRRRAVTTFAVRGESSLLVIRIRRALIIRQVTTRAIRRSTRVLPACVTERTVGHAVLTIERKNQVVIERRSLPARCRGAVTALAVGGEPGLLMTGVARRLVIREVATGTI